MRDGWLVSQIKIIKSITVASRPGNAAFGLTRVKKYPFIRIPVKDIAFKPYIH